MHTISGTSIANVWEESIRLIASKSEKVSDAPSGLLTVRLLNAALTVSDCSSPQVNQASHLSTWPDEYLKEYSEFICTGEVDAHLIRQRMLLEVPGGVSQLDWLRKQLADEESTRRGVIAIWLPHLDCPSERPTGLMYLHFIRDDDKLNLSAFLRSNDAWNAAYPDMHALVSLLRYEAQALGVVPGSFTHFVSDYHIYLHDLSYVKTKLSQQNEKSV